MPLNVSAMVELVGYREMFGRKAEHHRFPVTSLIYPAERRDAAHDIRRRRRRIRQKRSGKADRQ